MCQQLETLGPENFENVSSIIPSFEGWNFFSLKSAITMSLERTSHRDLTGLEIITFYFETLFLSGQHWET